MAFCGYCGAEMPDDMSFCTECGKPLTRGKKVIDSAGSAMVESRIDQENTDITADEQPFYQENMSKTDEEPSDVRWTMSEGMDLTEPENLYNSLKHTNDRKIKEEKKKFILPLVLTLIFGAIAVVLVVIKFKPYEKWFNKQEESISEEEAETSDASEEIIEETEVKPTQTVAPSVSTESDKEPEIKDMQACFRPINPYFDYVYVDYYYEVYNPNTTVMFEGFRITWNLRDSSDSILGTDTAQINLIMPGETAYVFGTIQLTKSEAEKIYSDDAQYEWDVKTESRFYSPIRQSEIEVTNVSARGIGYDTKVTGEVKNNSEYDTSAFTQVYVTFWKGEDLVAIESTYLDSVYSGSSRVFEVRGLHDIPDYDTVQIYVDVY